MRKLQLWSVLLALCILPSTMTYAKQEDPLKKYHADIERLQNDASQKVLDQLRASQPNNVPDPSTTQTIHPKKQDEIQQEQDNVHTNPYDSHPDSNNPWLKQNPWETKTEANPWANASTANNDHAVSSAQPPPTLPNIFAPTQSGSGTTNKSTVH